MSVAVGNRRQLKAGAAAAVAGMVAVSPALAVAPVPGMSTAERALRLLAQDSILNIPLNLIQDLANIPYYQVQANNVLASSLFFTGNWWTPSATNIWGEDPGDPGHFMAVMDYLFPFAPEISGVDQPAIDPSLLATGNAGLGQQLAMLAAAELPVSAACDAIQCSPMVPTVPITGLTGLDRTIHFFNGLGAGPDQQPMFAHWFQVPIQDLLNGFTFASGPGDTTNPTATGIVNPDAGIGPGGSVPGASLTAVPGGEAQPGFGFPGTIDGPNGENLMPWAGVTFKLDPMQPFQNWFQSLQQPVDISTYADGFKSVSLDDIFQSMKAVQAGLLVDFNSSVPGSPACPALCDGTSPFAPVGGITTEDVVKAIQATGAPNPLIAEWLRLTDAVNTDVGADSVGTANGATNEQVVAAIDGLQTGLFTFDSQTQETIIQQLIALDNGQPWLAKLAINSGVLTDPGIVGPWGTSGQVTGETGTLVPPDFDPSLPLDQQTIGDFGGLNPLLVWPDFLHLIGLGSIAPADATEVPMTDSPEYLAAGLLDLPMFDTF